MNEVHINGNVCIESVFKWQLCTNALGSVKGHLRFYCYYNCEFCNADRTKKQKTKNKSNAANLNIFYINREFVPKHF